MANDIPARAQAVLDFWFGAPGSELYGSQRKEWFRKDTGFDASIGQRFGTLIDRALQGGLREWQARPEAALARILLLDQFTRNVFRGTPRAFAGDALALEAAHAMVALGDDLALPPVERSFVYMPFEHAEDIAMQDEAIRLFTALASEHAELTDRLDWAERHRTVIRRFGRFPHRNGLLGRPSTAEEIEFLAGPGSSF